MTPSYQTLQILDKVKGLLTNKDALLQLLGEAESIYFQLFNSLLNIVTYTDSYTDLHALRTNLVNAYATKLKAVRARLIFSQIELLEKEVKELAETIPTIERLIGEHITVFTNSYEHLLGDSSQENTLQVVMHSHLLYTNLLSVVSYSKNVNAILSSSSSCPAGYGEISLCFSSDSSYRRVIVKLSAIEEIYSELCQLVEVSTSEYPLQISRIESGSLWLKLFGESKIIALLCKFIESSATFLYRNYTVEGKVSAIPRQLESIEAIMHVAQRLEEQGVNTSKVKDNLQKSMILISERMNDLLVGEPAVIVNGEELSVGEAYTEKFLSESRNLLLENGSENDDGKSGG